MRFSLHIDCSNAAFHEHDDGEQEPCLTARSELGRIIASVAGSVHAGQTDGRVRDENGNTVGSWSLDTDDDEDHGPGCDGPLNCTCAP